MAGILDCPIPAWNHRMFLCEEVPEVIQLAEKLRQLDTEGKLIRYKAIQAAVDCEEVADMEVLTAEVDDYFVDASIHTPEDVARSELSVVLCSVDEETLLPHIDLDGYGRTLLKRDHSMVTGYGLVERKDHQPVQRMEHRSQQGGMEMSL